ncbi:hypothetical protein FISHEDRAFT_54955 [Fistulina hepatica ATCC 64428]|uniref:Uncharacterized protein n=1 Tax=Fistulina hepatica ATCC 64428 TaxID=1128425 RepID=A0A0D7AQF8_9AGAR|nr:hypothetical protein FISHEDRAFT_54955 [Fistulina hepatica ATCC 64428]
MLMMRAVTLKDNVPFGLQSSQDRYADDHEYSQLLDGDIREETDEVMNAYPNFVPMFPVEALESVSEATNWGPWCDGFGWYEHGADLRYEYGPHPDGQVWKILERSVAKLLDETFIPRPLLIGPWWNNDLPEWMDTSFDDIPRRFDVSWSGDYLVVSDLTVVHSDEREVRDKAFSWCPEEVDDQGLPLIVSCEYFLLECAGGDPLTTGDEPLLLGEEYVRMITPAAELDGEYVIPLRTALHHNASPINAVRVARARARDERVNMVQRVEDHDLGEAVASAVTYALDWFSVHHPGEFTGYGRYLVRRINREGSHLLIRDRHLRIDMLLDREALLNPWFNIGEWAMMTRRRWNTRLYQRSSDNDEDGGNLPAIPSLFWTSYTLPVIDISDSSDGDEYDDLPALMTVSDSSEDESDNESEDDDDLPDLDSASDSSDDEDEDPRAEQLQENAAHDMPALETVTPEASDNDRVNDDSDAMSETYESAVENLNDVYADMPGLEVCTTARPISCTSICKK